MAKKKKIDKINSTLASIKARFENGSINKMSDLSEMNVTLLKEVLGMGFDGLIGKCAAPEKFVIRDLVKLSQVAKIDIDLIMKVVLKEAVKNVDPIDLEKLLDSEK
jgi:hypothetical protein